MNYSSYVENLERAFQSRFKEMSARYNFDLGDEFEIALCHILREVFPAKYGIARGFVVARNGSSSGDDIVIYDAIRFPTLRLFPQESYEIKQEIPVEAVYAYIEAKHTMHIAADMNDRQSLIKASAQVASVKAIPRRPRTPEDIYPYLRANVSFGSRSDWPPQINPVFGAVIARQIRMEKDEPLLGPEEGTRALVGAHIGSRRALPDMIIAGENHIILPCVEGSEGPIIHAPFYVEGTTSSVQVMPTKSRAFATGICFLFYALDTIRLGRMPWEEMINQSLKESRFSS
jgi:hypothetical protein